MSSQKISSKQKKATLGIETDYLSSQNQYRKDRAGQRQS
jgi:hypothetical protein